jgi:hypothetical protein
MSQYASPCWLVSVDFAALGRGHRAERGLLKTCRSDALGRHERTSSMKSLLSNLMMIALLAAPLVAVSACTNDDGVDTSNGKAISDLDIGADITLDKGDTQQVTATVKYADGTSLDVTTSSDLVWNIGDTGVATISKDGLVTGVGTGATTIKATYQGKESASHALIVH